jgi:arsenate reductase (thioredoxin)
MKILILCTGNSCRSQMAHGFLQSFDNKLIVRSAGTEPTGSINQKAVEVMNEVGIDISHHTSDPVEKYLNEDWDYVITVCGEANEACPFFPGKVGTRLHFGFEDPSKAKGSEEFIHSEFIHIRDKIQKAFRNFYDAVLN